MRIISNIPISQIVVDRYSIVPQTLDLATKMINGLHGLPPIKVYKAHDSDKYILTDGRHRITAHKLCGKKEILCKYYDKCI